MDAPDDGQAALAFSIERVLPDLALLCDADTAPTDDAEAERALARLTRAVRVRDCGGIV